MYNKYLWKRKHCKSYRREAKNTTNKIKCIINVWWKWKITNESKTIILRWKIISLLHVCLCIGGNDAKKSSNSVSVMGKKKGNNIGTTIWKMNINQTFLCEVLIPNVRIYSYDICGYVFFFLACLFACCMVLLSDISKSVIFLQLCGVFFSGCYRQKKILFPTRIFFS